MREASRPRASMTYALRPLSMIGAEQAATAKIAQKACR
jgi:hypothetical protein